MTAHRDGRERCRKKRRDMRSSGAWPEETPTLGQVERPKHQGYLVQVSRLGVDLCGGVRALGVLTCRNSFVGEPDQAEVGKDVHYSNLLPGYEYPKPKTADHRLLFPSSKPSPCFTTLVFSLGVSSSRALVLPVPSKPGLFSCGLALPRWHT